MKAEKIVKVKQFFEKNPHLVQNYINKYATLKSSKKSLNVQSQNLTPEKSVNSASQKQSAIKLITI